MSVRGMLAAAGFGTRLAPLTDELPKPAVPVANQPLAAYALQHLVAAGLSELAVNTHHLGEALRRVLEPFAPAGVCLRFVSEPRILGTGGGVKNAWGAPREESFLVMNAKLLFAPNIAQLLALHAASEALATLVLQPMPPISAAARYGPVDIDAEGRIRGFLQPTLQPGLQRCMFTGVYVLHPRAHVLLPDEGCVVRQGFMPWLERGERVMGLVDHAPFADLGMSPGHYFAGNMDLVSGRRSWPGIIPELQRGTLIASTADVHPQASLCQCVIGEGAQVGPVSLEDAVVWPGARIDHDLRRVIVTSGGVEVRV